MDGMDSPPAAPWFSALPLSDPRCDNTSCTAFNNAYNTSQTNVPWLSQFLYGHWTAWIFAASIFLFGLTFWAARLRGILRSKSKNSLKDKPSRHVNGRPNLQDRIVALVRFLSYRRTSARFTGSMELPSFGVTVMIILSWVTATIMAFAQHPYYRQRRGYGSPPLGVRTGLMAFALIPLTWATSGKVNIISFFTGFGHEKLNVFHRWTAYLVVYLSVIHTVPFIYQPLHEGGSAMLASQWYSPASQEYSGTPLFGMLVGLAALSVPWVRRYAYELFVQIHILLAITFLGLSFWHAAQCGDSWTYLYATLAIFLFQFVVRWFGKNSVFQLGESWFRQAPVTIVKLKDGMLKLEIDVPGIWKWEPGQHAFLRFFNVRPLDNHPFTITGIPRVIGDETRMTFLVRPYEGITARIAALADSGKSVSAIVDGPYGTVLRPKVEQAYDHAILVAGGGGISGMLPWLQHITNSIGKPGNRIKSVTLIWAFKTTQSLSWVEDALEACQQKLPEESLNISLYITSELGRSERSVGGSGEGGGGEKEVTKLHSASGDLLQLAHTEGRPDLFKEIPNLVGDGKTIILGCGPTSLKSDLSNSVAILQRRVLTGQAKEIRLHTETFGW